MRLSRDVRKVARVGVRPVRGRAPPTSIAVLTFRRRARPALDGDAGHAGEVDGHTGRRVRRGAGELE